MINIKIAPVCGLCAGCHYAINLAKDTAKKENTIIFKEIVHNKNINNQLKSLGITFAENLKDLNMSSSVIIRAHGEPPETYEYLKANKINYYDGTCKNVKSIHNEVLNHSEHQKIIIIGKYGKHSGVVHPEIFGTVGYSKNNPILIEDIEDVDKLKSIKNQNLFAICQTTFNPILFDDIKNKILDICKENNNQIEIKNTICGAQIAIQKSSLILANDCDLMIIVGGKNSSNTIELYKNISNICQAIHIEDINGWLDELKSKNISLSNINNIGLTAGASTDKNELLNLKKLIENYFETKKEG